MNGRRIRTVAAAMLAVFASGLQAQEIFDAVRKDDLTRIEALARRDASAIKARDGAGDSPLHLAASNGSLESVRLLLALGAEIDAVNARLETPLHAAVRNGKDEAAGLLLETGADLGRKDLLGNTVLHAAVENDRTGLVQRLLSRGAEVDSRNEDRWTPFLRAARDTGNVEVGRMLLRHGADVNAQDGVAYRPLNWAAYFGNREFVELLLDSGADYDPTEGKGTQILRDAARFGLERLFRFAAGRETEAFADGKAGAEIMSAAIAGGSVAIVEALRDRKVPLPRDPDLHGWLPVHHAARRGQSAMIEFLVAQGADVGARTPSGRSAYNVAEAAGRKETMSLLLKLGADASPRRFPRLEGPWLGQDPPGREPRVFAPDLVLPAHSSVAATPDGKELYWQSAERTIWTTRWGRDGWTEPEAVPFSRAVKGRYADDVPFIAPDGKRMFFTSTRPVEGSEPGKENVWVVERSSSAGWADPKPLGPEVNSLLLHWQVSVSAAGTLYFSGTGPDGRGAQDLYSSRLVDGRFTRPVNLGSVLNGPDNEASPCVAPNESYLVFMKGGDWEFFISYKGPDGEWLPPTRLSPAWKGYCPLVSPDGRRFFYVGFPSPTPAAYWVDAGFIEEMRPGRTSRGPAVR